MQKSEILDWLKEGNITIPAMLLSQYKQMNLSEQELVLLLHVQYFLERGNAFPTPVELANRMTASSLECSKLLRSLIQKGFIEIIEGYSQEGIRFERYSLQPLQEKLVERFLGSRKKEQARQKQSEESDVYTCFEKEFGRPLSPFECETLGMWMDDDQHDPIIIKYALREAVISGKLNFRYIDRILFEWKKNGIKTIEQARKQSRKFRQHQSHNQRPLQEEAKVQSRPVPFYNWLEQ
ncbi:DnaD domain-containing protein [Bacillus massilinigeriensis]|uniref:DnaD domain-containing protein n=1 Tax=Bacillus mediterraneensis TaxID=1805474 RepID=UPI0008F8894A|nr:DnaD domain-containing protein [Bacillus mediterraneensis]